MLPAVNEVPVHHNAFGEEGADGLPHIEDDSVTFLRLRVNGPRYRRVPCGPALKSFDVVGITVADEGWHTRLMLLYCQCDAKSDKLTLAEV
jgi:hypothetical protein